MSPQRTAFVCTDPGIPVFGSKGASVHAQSVLGVLVDAGHEVHVVTPRPGPIDDHPLAGSVRVHRLPEIGSGPAADREQRARTSDRRVADVLDRLRPDLVYERYALWGRTATRWSADHGVPSVLEVNSPLVQEQAQHRELADPRAAVEVARGALTAATAVVCVSDQVAGWARTLSGRPETIMVLPNGVDTDRIRPTDRPVSGADDVFTVGFVGTLKAWHGVEHLITAMSLRDNRSWRLLVVGDGPLREQLIKQAESAGIDAEFTGAVAPDRIAGQLQRMDVGCAPYPDADDHYFSPLKVYEYLAAGLPVLASSIGQIPEILQHGRLGRLVPPGDPAALATALEELQADVAERRRLASAGRAVAVAEHTWTGVVDRALASAGVSLRSAEPALTGVP